MAQTIILKKSAVAGKVPQASDLEVGEVAINMADRILYFKDSSGEVVAIKGEAAEELTQAQVESSASTDFGLVSGQRIWQALAKWWEGIGTVFGKTLLGSANGSAARTTLGLGTAATRDVATNAQALAGTAGVLPDAAGVHDAFKQYGLGTRGETPDTQAGGNVSRFWAKPSYDVLGYWSLGCYHGIDPVNGVLLRTLFNPSNPRVFSSTFSSGGEGTRVELIHTGNIRSTTGQSTEYPMTQKAVTDAIAARGFEDASGVLTAQSGDLSNAISNFLQATTQADAKSILGVPNITVSTSNPSGGANGDVWYKV